MTDQLKRAINDAQIAQNDAKLTDNAGTSSDEQHFDVSESTYKTSHTAVRKARRFAMQGLYEWLVTDRRFDTTGKLGWKDNAPHDIAARTRATNAMHTVHIGYYHEMMRDIPEQIESLDALIEKHLDRTVDKLDKVEHAILLIGAYELQNRIEIPYKVVMDEAMKLNNHFGATDAHKLINAVLDRMAMELRAVEVEADTKANKRNSQKPVAPTAATKNESAASVETDGQSAAATKPRISANKTGVKRNRPNNNNTGTSKAKAAAINNEQAKLDNVAPIVVAENQTVTTNPMVKEDKVVDQTVVANEAIIADQVAATDDVDVAPIVEDSSTEVTETKSDNVEKGTETDSIETDTTTKTDSND